MLVCETPTEDYMNSYTCGGMGHMSRDCPKGSKCYNCSGIVGNFSFGAFRKKLTL